MKVSSKSLEVSYPIFIGQTLHQWSSEHIDPKELFICEGSKRIIPTICSWTYNSATKGQKEREFLRFLFSIATLNLYVIFCCFVGEMTIFNFFFPPFSLKCNAFQNSKIHWPLCSYNAKNQDFKVCILVLYKLYNHFSVLATKWRIDS